MVGKVKQVITVQSVCHDGLFESASFVEVDPSSVEDRMGSVIREISSHLLNPGESERLGSAILAIQEDEEMVKLRTQLDRLSKYKPNKRRRLVNKIGKLTQTKLGATFDAALRERPTLLDVSVEQLE